MIGSLDMMDIRTSMMNMRASLGMIMVMCLGFYGAVIPAGNGPKKLSRKWTRRTKRVTKKVVVTPTLAFKSVSFDSDRVSRLFGITWNLLLIPLVKKHPPSPVSMGTTSFGMAVMRMASTHSSLKTAVSLGSARGSI
jgi:hypothetical protein